MSSGFPTANFSATEKGLFTPEEIQRLMQIEFDRAVRYQYPISLMLVEVDRLEYLHDLYGLESREEILQAVVAQMRSITRESDFLGCMKDDRLQALFPHTPEVASNAIAGRLLRGCRELAFDSDGRKLRITLSVGLATTTVGSGVGFEEFVNSTMEGLRYASETGGDRYVRRETAAVLIEDLRDQLETEARSLKEQAIAIATPLPVIEDLPRENAGQRIRELFGALPERSDELLALENDVVVLTEAAIELARERAVAEHAAEQSRHVDVLERRVTKLKELLDATEAELHRIAELKGVDSGIASIYRSVQGLPQEDRDYKRKKEVLTILFEANVELRRQIEEQSG